VPLRLEFIETGADPEGKDIEHNLFGFYNYASDCHGDPMWKHETENYAITFQYCQPLYIWAWVESSTCPISSTCNTAYPRAYIPWTATVINDFDAQTDSFPNNEHSFVFWYSGIGFQYKNSVISVLSTTVSPSMPPSPPSPPTHPLMSLCVNECTRTSGEYSFVSDYNSDGSCDDGGSGSEYSFCSEGKDCADCGPRTVPYPPLPPYSPPPPPPPPPN
jgi:hypothetical protein